MESHLLLKTDHVRGQTLRRSGQLIVVILALTAPGIFGCAGPKHLADGDVAYNEAIKNSANRELLLNIVRLRYLDTIEFLSIPSVTSSSSFSVGLGAIGGAEEGFAQGTGTVNVGYSTTPTFIFVPQSGAEFADLLTQPIHVDDLISLESSNVDIRHLFRLLVQEMNGLWNVVRGLDPEFIEIIDELTKLQEQGDAWLGFIEERHELSGPIPVDQLQPSDFLAAAKSGFSYVMDETGNHYVLTTLRKRPALQLAADAEGRDKIVERLRLDPSKLSYPIVAKTNEAALDEYPGLIIATRSLLDALAYLAHGVDVPESHLEKGYAPAHSPRADAPPVPMANLFRLASSRSKPDAGPAVRYRGYWFYVRNGDFATKQTLLVLSGALRFAHHTGTMGPVLTLPVGR